MIAPIYRFYLQVEDGQKTLAHPIYKADATLDYQQDNGKRFFRRQLNGRMTFVRDDYDLIMSATYEQTITFYIEISTDMGLAWTPYWQGTFSRTDCTIDFADHTISVQPTTDDEYKAILKGIDKEFNLIELLPQTDRILVTKRPLIQMYVPNDSVVSCFLSGSNWEEEAEETDNQYALINNYHFALNTILKEIEVTSVGGLADAVGTYTGRMFLTDEEQQLYAGTLYEKNGNYCLEIESHAGTIPQSGGIQWTAITVALVRISDDAIMYSYITSGEFDTKEFNMTPYSGSGATGQMHCDMKTYNVYARILCDVETLRTPTFKIPSDDIVIDNRNYRRCQPYISPSAYLSNNYSVEPTKYGRRDDGTYFDKPSDTTGFVGDFYPIAQSTWRYASLWYAQSVTYIATEVYGRKKYILRDAYEIGSCINVLLKQIAPDITHESTPVYSQFLYGTPNPVSGDKWYLYLTQKTNILKGEYTEPASKAMTSLQMILRMLADVFNCYWFIDNGKLRIEHISWFRNGGSYTADTRQVGYDLTQLINIKNGKPWAYGQGEVTFDKQDLPDQYQYSWMDDCTMPFDGYPIDVNSPNVEDGKIEDISISNFTSDVDYMLLNPSDCSNDGFALMAAVNANAMMTSETASHGERGVNDSISTPLYPIYTDFIGDRATITMQCTGNGTCNAEWFDSEGQPLQMIANVDSSTTTIMVNSIPSGASYFGFVMLTGSLNFNVYSISIDGEYELPFISKQIGNIDYILQNGYLAMVDLQPKYLTFDMPSRNISINGVQTTAMGVSRKAKQSVTFPADAVNLDTNVLIKTLVGFGEIGSLSLNLSSRIIKATINYDNDI